MKNSSVANRVTIMASATRAGKATAKQSIFVAIQRQGPVFPVPVNTVKKDTISIYIKSKRYGSPKITDALSNQGWQVGKNRDTRRMKQAGLKSIVRRKYRPPTDSKHSHPVAANLLKRNFNTSSPDRVWASDITYIATQRGWLYLMVFIDLFSRLVVGWFLSSSLSTETVLTALHRSTRRRNPPAGLTTTRRL